MCFLDCTGEDPISRTELTVLNIKDSKTGSAIPIPVPQEGIEPAYHATRNTLEALKWLGHREIVLRTDCENAIEKLAEHVAVHRGPDTRTAPETTPIGDSKSNGFIKNVNRFLEARTRTLLSALSRKIGCRNGGDWDVYP